MKTHKKKLIYNKDAILADAYMQQKFSVEKN